MKAIIMAAGKSTRTYPLTLTRPKPLLRLLDGTILSRMLDTLKEVGVDEAIIIVNYMKDKIIKAFGDEYKGIKIRYAEQDEPKGTGHAALCAAGLVDDENIIIMNGDDVYAPETIKELVKKAPSIAVKEVKTPHLYGIYEVEEKNGELYAKTLEEKPEKPKSNYANLGLYYFEAKFLNYLKNLEPSPRGELEITDGIKQYMKEKPIRIVKAEPYWLPIGHPWDLLTATERLLGKKDCSVIGKNVKIGEGTIIENSLIFGDAEIGKNCRIRNSIIGFGVKIGDNVETLDTADEIYSRLNGNTIKVNRKKYGATIGDNAVVENNVVTHPGVKIWPNVVVKGEVKEDSKYYK
ncbi:NTP transferase domain-containing protein [Candidatus Woesearchaeota archaeon]|nr:NTP transferase domain-containing protein [Candidatus Woesearchaeota archaeon]